MSVPGVQPGPSQGLHGASLLLCAVPGSRAAGCRLPIPVRLGRQAAAGNYKATIVRLSMAGIPGLICHRSTVTVRARGRGAPGMKNEGRSWRWRVFDGERELALGVTSRGHTGGPAWLLLALLPCPKKEEGILDRKT